MSLNALDNVFKFRERVLILALIIPTFFICWLSLYGLFFEIAPLVQFHKQSAPVTFNGTCIFLIITISLFALIYNYRKISSALAIVVIFFASLLLFETLFKINLGIDEWLFKSNMHFDVPYPGRPATNVLITFILIGFIIIGLTQKHYTYYSTLISGFFSITVIGINLAAMYGFFLGIQEAIMWFDFTKSPLLSEIFGILFGSVVLYISISDFYQFYPLESTFFLPSLIAICSLSMIMLLFISFATKEIIGEKTRLKERSDFFASLMQHRVPLEFSLLTKYKNKLLQVTDQDLKQELDEIEPIAFAVSPSLKELAIINSKGEIFPLVKSDFSSDKVDFTKFIPFFETKKQGIQVLFPNKPLVMLWESFDHQMQRYIVAIYEPENLFIPSTTKTLLNPTYINIKIDDIPVVTKKYSNQSALSFGYDTKLDLKELHVEIGVPAPSTETTPIKILVMGLPIFMLFFFIGWIVYFFNRVSIVTTDLRKALDTQTTFLANISHDMRTPLQGVTGASDLLANSGLTPKQSGFLQIIAISTKDLKDLVSNILDITKMELGKIILSSEQCNIIKLCQEHIDTIKSMVLGKKIDIFLEYPKDKLPSFKFSVREYGTILDNLLSNALAFTNTGSITVQIEFIKTNAKHGKLITKVIDTGIGINPEKIPYLFHKFRPSHLESTKKTTEGAGLGLYLIKLILDAMHGTIEVQSEVNHGSTFTVTIPVEIIN